MGYTPQTIHSGVQSGGLSTKNAQDLVTALEGLDTAIAAVGDITALTDSTGGTANDTVAQVADIALSTSDTYTDAAVNSAVNTAIATINDDLADLAAKVNEIIAALA
jgi:hypothetical protein